VAWKISAAGNDFPENAVTEGRFGGRLLAD
jgi:hypothetical protein